MQQTTGYDIDMTLKSAQLFSALDGNLLYEIEQAAQPADQVSP